nr:hypothetical protein [Mycoplasmopsis bovis]
MLHFKGSKKIETMIRRMFHKVLILILSLSSTGYVVNQINEMHVKFWIGKTNWTI